MNSEIWQQLLSLESRDIVAKWFDDIHSRELNARRTKEITSCAKQAREYFRNAANSSYSVRPLLTFYGVASLSRSLLLLLRRNGGEESLTGSHGLETVDWSGVMAGEIANGLQNLGDLKIRTRSGLFSEFVSQTQNRVSIHVNSSGVDWHVCYDIPDLGIEITVNDLFSRMPDLQKDFYNISNSLKYASVNEMTYSHDKGFRAKVQKESFLAFRGYYESVGYSIVDESGWSILTADADTFAKKLPLFTHSYLHKTFGTIPVLYLSKPFFQEACYSQLCITYMASYVLGMLVRYYPTHWMALTQGDKGDRWWPSVNRAQQVVESSFPELVIELIDDVISTTTALTEVERNGGRVSAADGDDNNFGERVAVLRVAIRTKPGAVWVNERVRARQFQASV